jgi:hypothetical protein
MPNDLIPRGCRDCGDALRATPPPLRIGAAAAMVGLGVAVLGGTGREVALGHSDSRAPQIASPQSLFDHEHRAWTAILAQYVMNGSVDYRGLADHGQPALNDYLSALSAVHPRCDFACTGCYLGAGANGIRPILLEQTFRQLDELRAWLGPKGNAQITDGEVTLLPAKDLLAILRYARRIGLIPMVMTHGDTFRRRPGLLEQLMTEGGLAEISIHIDTTQRGRLGYTSPHGEDGLQPLIGPDSAHACRTVETSR